MKIVHLPYYNDNPYQAMLMATQRGQGHEVIEGGGGGNFLGIALRKWKADVVHFHWLHPYLLRETKLTSIKRSARFFLEVLALRLCGARILWTIHNLANHDGRFPVIERHATVLFAWLTHACFVHSTSAKCSASKDFRIPLRKIEVIPHGHYLDYYENRISQTEARQKLGLPSGDKVFLFFGRIEPYKGVYDLIDAFASLPENCHLVIAGKTNDEETRAAISGKAAGNPRIHVYPKRIPDGDLQIFFNASDLVVFPFRKILASGSLVLAMSFRKKVVAPEIESLQEIVPEGGACWFKPGDARSLAEAMIRSTGGCSVVGGDLNLARAREWGWSGIAETLLTR